MHDDEQVATAVQVARLVAAQFPQWAHLPVAEVDEFGTDHLLFRLGGDLVARMPRAPWATDQAESDARWAERDRFRDAVGYDDDTWRRAAGWALAPALNGIRTTASPSRRSPSVVSAPSTTY